LCYIISTPFIGNSQVQLLQNILRSTELHLTVDRRDLSTDCKDICQEQYQCIVSFIHRHL
ncbi:unnamed protein product, partial [Brassica oleracea var. botrytis]